MFKQALTEIVERTEGATGALIMGMDGIAVERVLLPEGSDANMDVAAAEVTSLVRSAMRAGNNTGHGAPQELFISFEGARVVARPRPARLRAGSDRDDHDDDRPVADGHAAPAVKED